MSFLYEKATANVTFELSALIATFVFVVPVDVGFVTVNTTTFIETFVALS